MIQRERFAEQAKQASAGDDEAQVIMNINMYIYTY